MHELIQEIRRERNTVTIVPATYFGDRFTHEPFFVRYGDDVDLTRMPLAVVTAPFVMNVAPVIWASGESFVVDEIDADLQASLASVHEVLRSRLYPDLAWDGCLVARTGLRSAAPSADVSAGVLFSGGLDSVCTSLRHRSEPQRLITIRGADVDLTNHDGWLSAQEQTRSFAAAYGFAASFVESNFKTFLNRGRLDGISPSIPRWWGHVQHGLGLTGLCMPLCYSAGSSRVYIGATHSDKFQRPWGSHPLIDDAVRVAGIRVVHDSFDLSRQQKLGYLAEVCRGGEIARPVLRVCYARPRSAGGNCGRCEKCLRTMVGLILEEEDPRAYGFEREPLDVVANLRRKFRRFAIRVSPPIWRDLQDRARSSEGLSPETAADVDEARTALVDWLANFDFGSYRRRAGWYIDGRRRLKDRLRSIVRAVRRARRGVLR